VLTLFFVLIHSSWAWSLDIAGKYIIADEKYVSALTRNFEKSII
jgi:hypothetical protein